MSCTVLQIPFSIKPFQRRFLAGAFAPGIDTAALSIPRGNGKSALAGLIIARAMTPGDPLHVPGKECILGAASIKQGRIVYKFAREYLGGPDNPAYRYQDAMHRIGIFHKATNTRTDVISSSGKTAMGLGADTNIVIIDEPGAMEVNGGQLLNDAVDTALGKPGSVMRLIYIGTLAPAMSGWWHDLVKRGSRRGVYVMSIQGDPERWDQYQEIRKTNPLCNVDAKFRRKLLTERDSAREDPRLKARFLSYRMNLPTPDETTVLLTADDWRRVMSRPLPPRSGRFTVGYDLGGGRAWSAAVACWKNGRVEAIAVAPGIPNLTAQEKRDRVPRGTYEKLHGLGVLRIAEGLRVQPPGALHRAVIAEWGTPDMIMCDYFRLNELRDVVGYCNLEPRRPLWSSGSEDVRALRKLSMDGPLSCGGPSAALIAASLAVAVVECDTSGNVRLRKGSANTARDDVAAALILACGSLKRELDKGDQSGFKITAVG